MSHLIQQILPLIKNEIHYMDDDSYQSLLNMYYQKPSKSL